MNLEKLKTGFDPVIPFLICKVVGNQFSCGVEIFQNDGILQLVLEYGDICIKLDERCIFYRGVLRRSGV